MNNLVVLPIIIPLIAGLILVIFRKKLYMQRFIALFAILATFTVAVMMALKIKEDGIQVLQAGGWAAPYGISLVADMFAVILLIITAFVSFCCLFYAFYTIGRLREENFFYPLFLFMISGVNGSFLTGDIFNLFVFFELMLISSYALITLGGEKKQLRESIKYILINVMSSFFFLVAVAYLYAVTGTLNMAHLSVRVAEAGQSGLMTTVAILLLMVFSLKAGLLLFYWLPGSYSVPPTAVAAIFAALLTKVGIYAIFRMFTLIFYHQPEITHLLIGILGAATMLLGVIGAVSRWDIEGILTYNVIISVGLIMAGLAAFTTGSITGSVFYLVHDINVKALIFLIGGTIIYLTGTANLKEISGLIRTHPFLGWMFFIASLALAGIPPFSGFLGKLLITKGTFEAGEYWLGAIGLISSLLVLYSVMKIFMNAFWGETNLSEDMEKGTTRGIIVPITLLTAVTIFLGLGGESISAYIQLAAEGLMNPDLYIDAVLGE
ncbi:monovalent cation/H+ antiporter subunit D [Bacillus sp. FJAT-27916]|uniref:Na+/H+ antiporter subunit D n=1 Tax=Bacillaceae TaxID=186817 RepID=UPI0006708637|nr:Na+/H+ antiporter subunit D [Bacillus sp. FJAT-27916]KMY43097.1 monovalent cation/H+ antiporter subunit D [Bacillus sp. FJAT-27916]